MEPGGVPSLHGPSRSLPALPCTLALLPSQDHLIRPPGLPLSPRDLPLCPSGWTVSPALKPTLAAPRAGDGGIGLGTCRSSVCLWWISWTLVTTSPCSFSPHSGHTARWAITSGMGQGLPEGNLAGREEEALPRWCSPWLVGTGGSWAPHSGLSCRQETLARRKVPFSSFW